MKLEWSLLEATQDSLHEHMSLLKHAQSRIKELEKIAVKTVSDFDHMLDEKDRRIKELESQNTFWACKKHTQQNTLRCAICDEQHIKELEAKLEAVTTAMESIATHSDGIPGDEGDDAFYDYCEVKDLAAATLKSIREK